MALTIRSTLGRLLTPDEVDNNFIGLSNGSNFAAVVALAGTLSIAGGITTPSISSGAASALILGTLGGTHVIIPHTPAAVNTIQLQGAPAGGLPLIGVNGETNVSLEIGSKGTGSVDIFTDAYGANVRQLRVKHVAGAVNFLEISGDTSSNQCRVTATGTDANVGINFNAKGIGTIDFRGASGGDLQAGIFPVAGAVNYLAFSGATAGNKPTIGVAGTDANIGIRFSAKGTALDASEFSFVDGAGNLMLEIDHDTGTVANFFILRSKLTGSAPAIIAVGSDTNIGMTFSNKGTGNFSFLAPNAIAQFRIRGDASAPANWIDVFGQAAGLPAILRSEGETNAALDIYSKGSGSIRLGTASGTPQVVIAHVASAVNGIQLSGGATAGAVNLQAIGVDTNVQFNVKSKGTGNMVLATGGVADVQFYTNIDTASALQAAVAHVASAVNYLQFAGAATATRPSIIAKGTDTNIGLLISSKGTGDVLITTRDTAGIVAQFVNTASSVNWVGIVPGAAGGAVGIFSDGSDTNIQLSLTSKGTSSVVLSTNNFAQAQVVIAHSASAVNQLQLSGAATGGSVNISAIGTDANITLNISSKGTDPVDIFTNGNGVTRQVSILHTASATRNLTFTGSTTNPTIGVSAGDLNISTGIITTGSSISTTDVAIELGGGRTGSGACYLDLHAVTGTDYELRFLRASGTNGAGSIDHKGTGSFSILTNNSLAAAVFASDQSATLGQIGSDLFILGSSIPQNIQNVAYTLVAADANKHIEHTSATAHTYTIPANSSVAYRIGTAVTFHNGNAAGILTIAITTDTLRLSPGGASGSRTIAANGLATALKVTATEWVISGTGLT